MTIFAVIRQAEQGTAGTLASSVRAQFANAHYDLGNGDWLVSGRGTAEEIFRKIGITDGVMGTGLVVEVASYFGRANPAIWTWIKTNWEGQTVG